MCQYFLGALIGKGQLNSHCIMDMHSTYIDFIHSLEIDPKLGEYVKITYMDNISKNKEHFYYVYIPKLLKDLEGRKKLRELCESVLHRWYCDDFSWYRD